MKMTLQQTINYRRQVKFLGNIKKKILTLFFLQILRGVILTCMVLACDPKIEEKNTIKFINKSSGELVKKYKIRLKPKLMIQFFL